MTVTQRGSGWQVAFMVAGQRYREQFPTLQEAENWETEARLALKKGQPVPPTGYAPKKVPEGVKALETLGGLFDYTCKNHWDGKRSEDASVRNAGRAVNHFGRSKRTNEITPFDIEGYIKALKDRGQSGATINRHLAALSKMLTLALRHEVILHKPHMPHQEEDGGRLRFLTEDEAKNLVVNLRDAKAADDADLTEFLIDTGFRINEALTLDWTEVRGGFVTVLKAKSKGKRERTIPLAARSMAILARHRDQPGGPFRAMRYKGYRKRFTRAVDALGLQDVVIHTLRHTTASWLVMRGVDIYKVCKFMGHRDVKVTMIYAHLAPDSLAGIVNALDQMLTQPAAPAKEKEVA
jgi:site-specific recombinase XerD